MPTEDSSPRRFPTPPDGAPLLVLVHGVASKGEWYDAAEKVLGAHFRIIRTHHSSYLWRWVFGPVAVVLEPTVLLLALALALLTPFGGWGLPGAHPVGYWTVAIMLAALASPLRHLLAMRSIRQHLPAAHVLGASTHAIAHSMGTQLLLRLMTAFEYRFHRVVLAGSVLPCGFAWETCPCVGQLQVHNEVARWDLVSWLAGLGWRTGASGARGFRLSKHVHSSAALGQCTLCVHGTRVAVHNVAFPPNWHDDAFVGPRHIVGIWLPFLLGKPVGPYEAFTTACHHVAEQVTPGTRQPFLEAFLNSQSLWQGDSVAQRIEAQLRAHPRFPGGAVSSQDLAHLALDLAYLVMAAVSQIDEPSPNSELQRCLDPDYAIYKAVADFLRVPQIPTVPRAAVGHFPVPAQAVRRSE